LVLFIDPFFFLCANLCLTLPNPLPCVSRPGGKPGYKDSHINNEEVTMRLPAGFLLRIAKATQLEDEEYRKMSIIIRQPYAHLEEELLKTFEGQEDVSVILDRRFDDRRAITQPVETDRRKSDQRTQKEELVQVVIST
jgi:hypothetical protein